MITLPYWYAQHAAGPDFVFGGFLFNPLDGNSYLAKMYQGWRGDWRFTLPYSAEPGRGAFLFMFYILLGHFARLSHLSLPLVFHLARLAGAVLLLISLDRFFAIWLPEPWQPTLAYGIAALGSGVGWLAALFGGFTSDLWVAEAFPFLSAYATPHFSLGLALLLWLLGDIEIIGRKEPGSSKTGEPGGQGAGERGSWGAKKIMKGGRIVLAGMSLAVVSPFGVVVALVVFAGLALWDLWPRLVDSVHHFRTHALPMNVILRSFLGCLRSAAPVFGRSLPAFTCVNRFLLVFLGGGPFLLYYFWVARIDPVLAGWNAQNLTPSPPLWDLLVSISPAVLLALFGLKAGSTKRMPGFRLGVVWVGLGLLLLYLPFGLQRRFMMGLFVPVVMLAVLGVGELAGGRRDRSSRKRKFISALFLIFSLPTNLVILLAGLHGIQTHDPRLYLTKGESQAFEWIARNTPSNALVLASPETGLFIPAHTGRRVIYGHPFETVNAEAERAGLLNFFASGGVSPPLLNQYDVGYVFIGPRERLLGEVSPITGLDIAYSENDVEIFKVMR